MSVLGLKDVISSSMELMILISRKAAKTRRFGRDDRLGRLTSFLIWAATFRMPRGLLRRLFYFEIVACGDFGGLYSGRYDVYMNGEWILQGDHFELAQR
jgi:hypothetical protein